MAKAVSILDSEIVKAMKFLGAAKIEDLVPEMVCPLLVFRGSLLMLAQVERVDWQAKL